MASTKDEMKVSDEDMNDMNAAFSLLTPPSSISSLSMADHRSSAYSLESQGRHLDAIYHWYALAKNGDPQSFYRLANRFNWGWILKKNPSLALRLYRHAAKEGNHHAVALLPQFSFDGHTANMNHSLTLLTDIHKKGEEGKSSGEGTAKEKSSNENDIDTEYFYASLLENKLTNDIASGVIDLGKPSDKSLVKERVAEIVSIYERLSEGAKHAMAAMNLSYLYEKKNNKLDYFIEPNPKKRFYFLRIAVESHYDYAYFDMANARLKGIGCDKNSFEAVKYFEKSIENHVFENASYRELALIYLQDHNDDGKVKKDEKKSLDAVKKAVEGGDASAIQLLGSMYYYGNSVIQQDLQKAIELYQKASSLGNSKAFYQLGTIYQSGGGIIDIDEKKAADYFKQASDLGDAEGMYRLAVCYQLGRGAKKDRQKAIDYFKKAYRIGKLEDAKLALESLGVYD